MDVELPAGTFLAQRCHAIQSSKESLRWRVGDLRTRPNFYYQKSPTRLKLGPKKFNGPLMKHDLDGKFSLSFYCTLVKGPFT